MREQLTTIQDAINWACDSLNIEWHVKEAVNKKEFTPNLADAWVLEAIRLQEIAAYDLDDNKVSESELITPPLPTRFNWNNGHPAAWYSGIRYINQYGKKLSFRARDLSRSPDKKLAKLYIDKISEYVVPFIDAFIAEESNLDEIGKKRAFQAWFKASSYVAWSASFVDEVENHEIHKKIFRYLEDNRGLAASIDAVIFSSISMLDHAKESEEEISRIIKMAEPYLNIDIDTLDDVPDINGVVGALARMAYHSSPSERYELLVRTPGYLRRAYSLGQSRNLGWAVRHCINVLNLCDSDEIKDPQKPVYIDLLRVIVDTCSSNSLSAILEHADFHKLWGYLSKEERFQFLNAAWVSIVNESNERTVFECIKKLRVLSEYADGDALLFSWQQVYKLSVSARLFWVVECATSVKTEVVDSNLSLLDMIGIIDLILKDEMINSDQYNHYLYGCFLEVLRKVYKHLFDNFDTVVSWLADTENDVSNMWAILTIPFMKDLLLHNEEAQSKWIELGITLLSKPQAKLNTNCSFAQMAYQAIETENLCANNLVQVLEEKLTELKMESNGLDLELFQETISIILHRNFENIVDRWSLTSRLNFGLEKNASLIEYLNERASTLRGDESKFRLRANVRSMEQWCSSVFKDDEDYIEVVSRLSLETELHDYLPTTAVVKLPSDGIQYYKPSLIQGFYYLDGGDPDISWEVYSQTENLAGSTLENAISSIKENEGWQDAKIYKSKVSWWPDTELYQVRESEKPSAFYLFAVIQNRVMAFDGTSQPIHELNASSDIALDEKNVLSYLSFFCAVVEGDLTSFYVLTNQDDLMVEGSWDAIGKDKRAYIREPRFLGYTPNMDYICAATILYGGEVFFAEFLIQTSGLIQMCSDDSIAVDTGLAVDFLKKMKVD